MKALSASIVVMAAAILLVGGAQIAHSQTRSFVMLAGGVVGLLGMAAWGYAIMARDRSDR